MRHHWGPAAKRVVPACETLSRHTVRPSPHAHARPDELFLRQKSQKSTSDGSLILLIQCFVDNRAQVKISCKHCSSTISYQRHHINKPSQKPIDLFVWWILGAAQTNPSTPPACQTLIDTIPHWASTEQCRHISILTRPTKFPFTTRSGQHKRHPPCLRWLPSRLSKERQARQLPARRALGRLANQSRALASELFSLNPSWHKRRVNERKIDDARRV